MKLYKKKGQKGKVSQKSIENKFTKGEESQNPSVNMAT